MQSFSNLYKKIHSFYWLRLGSKWKTLCCYFRGRMRLDSKKNCEVFGELRGMGGNWMDDFRGRALPRSCNTRSGTEIISAGSEEGWRNERRSSGTSQEFPHHTLHWLNLIVVSTPVSCEIFPGLSTGFHHPKRFPSKSNKNYQLISFNKMDQNGFRVESFRFKKNGEELVLAVYRMQQNRL